MYLIGIQERVHTYINIEVSNAPSTVFLINLLKVLFVLVNSERSLIWRATEYMKVLNGSNQMRARAR